MYPDVLQIQNQLSEAHSHASSSSARDRSTLIGRQCQSNMVMKGYASVCKSIPLLLLRPLHIDIALTGTNSFSVKRRTELSLFGFHHCPSTFPTYGQHLTVSLSKREPDILSSPLVSSQ